METYILKKSKRKGKRFVIEMPKYKHKHHFGSDVGQTFIDHKDSDKKSAWYARHKNDKNWNSKHSGIYHSRKLLWTEPTLDKAINKYEKEHNIKIKKEL
jgi:hypothetical protein|tara:strand:- start:147 stop:443 length:297 start_codon:yes stop_codon:yes gene_type:complete